MSEKRTAKTEILRVLIAAGRPLSIEEIATRISGYSANAIATRVSELHAEGAIVGRTRPGTNYKEWRVATMVEQENILKSRPLATPKTSVPAAKVMAVTEDNGLDLGVGQVVFVTLQLPKEEWARAQAAKAVRFA